MGRRQRQAAKDRRRQQPSTSPIASPAPQHLPGISTDDQRSLQAIGRDFFRDLERLDRVAERRTDRRSQ